MCPTRVSPIQVGRLADVLLTINPQLQLGVLRTGAITTALAVSAFTVGHSGETTEAV